MQEMKNLTATTLQESILPSEKIGGLLVAFFNSGKTSFTAFPPFVSPSVRVSFGRKTTWSTTSLPLQLTFP
jgi:hypothetical protein